MAAKLNLFSIPSGAPFLDVLIDSILSNDLGLCEDMADPTVLARTTVYLPTRRAARAFNSGLASRFEGKALLLPRVVPLGDVDDAELALIAGDAALYAREAQPAIDPLRRRLELTKLILACGRTLDREALKLDPEHASLMPATLSDGFHLAGQLAELLDALQTEGIAFDALQNLDATRFDVLWAITAKFLDVIGKAWPANLAQESVTDPAQWRNLILDAERQRLFQGTVDGPIIAAGSTGTIPATARLLDTIARLPQGAVVLPGVDMAMDETSWRALGADPDPSPSHPQFALHHLLGFLEATRDDIIELDTVGARNGDPVPEADRMTGAGRARAALVQEALRPAATSETWLVRQDRFPERRLEEAFAGLSIVAAEDERSEALAVAIAMREVLETPGKTAALITPDRGLAERVEAELQRWGIVADDSAGRPLFRSAAGHLAVLIMDVIATKFAPESVLGLLNHPLVRLGVPMAQVQKAAATLEIGAIRGVLLQPGLSGLRAALAHAPERAAHRHAPRPRKLLDDAAFACAVEVLDRLEKICLPLCRAWAEPTPDLTGLAVAHRQAFLDVLDIDIAPGDSEMSGVSGRNADASPSAGPVARPDVQTVLKLFETVAGAGKVQSLLEEADDYTEIFCALSKEMVVESHGAGHPRLKIWGLLEARLMQADRIILGGLVEGVWPPATRTDAFLNRAMRRQVGLSSPERRIGQTAHDFVQAAAGSEVIVTRAIKNGGSETIASRFWQRLNAISPKSRWDEAEARGKRLIDLARLLSQPAETNPRPRPKPMPPAALQPLSLSVTEIETLYRDPFAIYARHVLKLDPLEERVLEPTAADRGTLLHAIVERFAKDFPRQLPPDALERLIEIGRKCFAEAHDAPEIAAFWWPRFESMAPRFLHWEEARRDGIAVIHTEVAASHDFELPGLPTSEQERFRLRAKADRIEISAEDGLRIIDFKTGEAPSAEQIRTGFAPQLTLQEALAVRGGFAVVGRRAVERSFYVRLAASGAHLDERPKPKEAPPAGTAEEHLSELLRQIALYRLGSLPFLPHRALENLRYARPYDQLARVKEWSGAQEGDVGDEP
jgi:ATP-dependent helicase/nuclease subunit B